MKPQHLNRKILSVLAILAVQMFCFVDVVISKEPLFLESKARIFRLLVSEFLGEPEHLEIAIVTKNKAEFVTFKRLIESNSQSKFLKPNANLIWYSSSPEVESRLDIAYFIHENTFEHFSDTCLSIVNGKSDFDKGAFVGISIEKGRPLLYIDQFSFNRNAFHITSSIRKFVVFKESQ